VGLAVRRLQRLAAQRKSVMLQKFCKSDPA
jgi:hypothetical protein